jgi:hypothetical protein
MFTITNIGLYIPPSFFQVSGEGTEGRMFTPIRTSTQVNNLLTPLKNLLTHRGVDHAASDGKEGGPPHRDLDLGGVERVGVL